MNQHSPTSCGAYLPPALFQRRLVETCHRTSTNRKRSATTVLKPENHCPFSSCLLPNPSILSVPWLLHGDAELQDLGLTVSAETSRDFHLSTAAMGLAVPTSQSIHGSPNPQLPECKCPQDRCIYNSIKIMAPCWGGALMI